jgi:hypothetical protein
MTEKHEPVEAERDAEAKANTSEDQVLQSRRGFLLGLGKWSRAVIVGAVAGGALLHDRPAQAGWINRRGGVIPGGGSWVNRRGGGYGGSWVNRR